MNAPEPNDDFKAPEVKFQNAASRTDRWLLAPAEQRAHTGLKLIKNIWLRCSQGTMATWADRAPMANDAGLTKQ